LRAVVNPGSVLSGFATVLATAVMVVLIVVAACSPGEDPSLFPEFNTANAIPPPTKENTAFNPERNLYWATCTSTPATPPTPISAV